MYLHFDFEEKLEFCEAPKDKWKKGYKELKSYPLFSHFLDLIGTYYEYFLPDLISEYKNRLRDFNKAIKDLQNEFYKSHDKRPANYQEIVHKKDEIMKEIQTEHNKNFGVNFDVGFYWMIFNEVTGDKFPYEIYDDYSYVHPDRTCISLNHFKSAIDYYINKNEAISLNLFYSICETARESIFESDIKIPSQHLRAHYSNGLLSLRVLFDFNNDVDWDKVRKIPMEYKNSYLCENPRDIIICSLYEITKNNYHIKKCDHCGNYFIPLGRADEKYCLRPSPRLSHLNCKEAAKYFKQLDRERSSESKKIYKSIYTMKLNKLNNAFPKDMVRFKNELDSFMAEAANWRENVKSGYKTEEEYVNWLNSFKKRGKGNGIDKEER